MREIKGWEIERADEGRGIMGFGACDPEDEFWDKQVNGQQVTIYGANLGWEDPYVPCISIDGKEEWYFDPRKTSLAALAKTVDMKGIKVELEQADVVSDYSDYEK